MARARSTFFFSSPQSAGPMDESSGTSTAHASDRHRRFLIRLMFWLATCTLFIFVVVNLHYERPILAAMQGAVGTGALIVSLRLPRTRYLYGWTMAFMLMIFSLLTYGQLVADSTETSWVWIFLMPVLAYSLLGLRPGFWISAPFVVIGVINYVLSPLPSGEYQPIGNQLNVAIGAGLILLFMHLYELGRARIQGQLVALAATDALTGLPNRGQFHHMLKRSIRSAQRRGTPFALIVLDLDHFKQVNDTLGHDAGDHVLHQLANCLVDGVRATDFVARLGGEEFAVILDDVTPADAHRLANHLHQQINACPFVYEEQSLSITATLGVALYPDESQDATDLYKMADERLYRGKNNGRNQVVTAPGAP